MLKYTVYIRSSTVYVLSPFDQYTKQFFDQFLSPFGTVERSYEIPGEPRQVDLYFIPIPQPAADLISLGLLCQRKIKFK
nr:MAG: hypothetical protein EDM05_13805 [Leptolyngbya sp. IPPAS B-1204]